MPPKVKTPPSSPRNNTSTSPPSSPRRKKVKSPRGAGSAADPPKRVAEWICDHCSTETATHDVPVGDAMINLCDKCFKKLGKGKTAEARENSRLVAVEHLLTRSWICDDCTVNQAVFKVIAGEAGAPLTLCRSCHEKLGSTEEERAVGAAKLLERLSSNNSAASSPASVAAAAAKSTTTAATAVSPLALESITAGNGAAEEQKGTSPRKSPRKKSPRAKPSSPRLPADTQTTGDGHVATASSSEDEANSTSWDSVGKAKKKGEKHPKFAVQDDSDKPEKAAKSKDIKKRDSLHEADDHIADALRYSREHSLSPRGNKVRILRDKFEAYVAALSEPAPLKGKSGKTKQASDELKVAQHALTGLKQLATTNLKKDKYFEVHSFDALHLVSELQHQYVKAGTEPKAMENLAKIKELIAESAVASDKKDKDKDKKDKKEKEKEKEKERGEKHADKSNKEDKHSSKHEKEKEKEREKEKEKEKERAKKEKAAKKEKEKEKEKKEKTSKDPGIPSLPPADAIANEEDTSESEEEEYGSEDGPILDVIVAHKEETREPPSILRRSSAFQIGDDQSQSESGGSEIRKSVKFTKDTVQAAALKEFEEKAKENAAAKQAERRAELLKMKLKLLNFDSEAAKKKDEEKDDENDGLPDVGEKPSLPADDEPPLPTEDSKQMLLVNKDGGDEDENAGEAKQEETKEESPSNNGSEKEAANEVEEVPKSDEDAKGSFELTSFNSIFDDLLKEREAQWSAKFKELAAAEDVDSRLTALHGEYEGVIARLQTENTWLRNLIATETGRSAQSLADEAIALSVNSKLNNDELGSEERRKIEKENDTVLKAARDRLLLERGLEQIRREFPPKDFPDLWSPRGSSITSKAITAVSKK